MQGAERSGSTAWSIKPK